MRFLTLKLVLLTTIAFDSSAQASHLTQGTRVLTRTTAEVRASPLSDANVVGTQPVGRLGSITAGPVTLGNDTWWEIDYAAGADGWSVEDTLVEAYFPPSESAGGWRSLVARNTTPSSAQLAEIREKTGLDWNKLKLANDYSNTLSAGSRVIVIRNGWIAAEWGNTNSITVASVTKSLTGLALGKLFDLSNAGELDTSIDAESFVYQYLPSTFGDSDPLKREIKVKHFMTMSSGIQSADNVAFTLTLDEALAYPMSAAPGEKWSYASLPVNLLSVVVQNVAGQSLQNFFSAQIAEPIGAVISSWGLWEGYTAGAGRASLTARNLARFGYLALRKGQWDNGSGLDQVIRRDTISLLTEWASFLETTASFESVPPFFAPDPEAHHYYGHLFWTNRLQRSLGSSVPADAYYLHGFKDNLCIVIPSLDMIVVRLATNGPGMDPAFRSEFMSRIMAAVISDSDINEAPIVDAGPDQTVNLPNPANLNGTVSDDGLPHPPGTITTVWSKVSGLGSVTFGNANAVDTTASFSVAGFYVLQLTATDGTLTTHDPVGVSVNPPSSGPVTISREAESGSRAAPMIVKSDSTASGGQFVEVPQGAGNNTNDTTHGGPGQVTFSIGIPQSSTYALWARTIAPNTGSDSFYVMRDSTLLKEWTAPLSTSWTWNKIANLSLTTGTVSISFRQREDGAKLDQILLTNDLGLVPGSGNQLPSVNAGPDQTVTLPNPANLNGTVSDDGLPNPPGTVTTVWTKVSGPGTVNFGNANVVDTTATFGAAGVYLLQLSASDGAASAQDMVSITVTAASGGAITLVHEAENGGLTAPMVSKSDSAASGGAFVEVPDGTGNNYSDATRGGPGEVSFSISIPRTATYALWARTIAPNGTSQSFYVMRNGALLKEWTVPLSTSWTWNKIANVLLSAGSIDLTFRQREDGTRLDQVLLTNDLGLVPSGTVQSSATTAASGTPIQRTLESRGNTVRVATQDFSLILLPPARVPSRESSRIFAEQIRWVVNNKDLQNIAYVAHLGGLVEDAQRLSEWDRAEAVISPLENPNTTGLMHGIPYGVAVSDREQSPHGDPEGNSTELYNSYFGERRFSGRSYYGGQFGTNNDNHYSLFSAGGMDFIVIFMEYDPRPDPMVLAWADNLLQVHPDRRAIIVSHDLLQSEPGAPFGTRGYAIYEALKHNRNLFLILGAHDAEDARRTDTFNDVAVHTLVSGYSDKASDGWLRILAFSPAANQIHVHTYSPILNRFKFDADRQFTLTYNMSE
jgi:CubicO group peptidase (beta-lactamase class C family)